MIKTDDIISLVTGEVREIEFYGMPMVYGACGSYFCFTWNMRTIRVSSNGFPSPDWLERVAKELNNGFFKK